MARKLSARSQQDKPAKVPGYEVVADRLRSEIAGAAGDQPVRLPPERELCDLHKVSRITIRKALDLLQHEGLIERSRAHGTRSIPQAVRQWQSRRKGGLIQIISHETDTIWNPGGYYHEVYQGMLDRCRQAAVPVQTRPVQVYRVEPDMGLSLPSADQVLGVAFLGLMNDAMIGLYADAGFPVVAVDYWTPNPKADAVLFDCYAEGQTAVEFLLRNGHTHLFFLGNRLGVNKNFQRESDSELMLAGAQRALAQAGVPPIPPERVLYAGLLEEQSVRDWFLSLTPRPTAGIVFTSSLCESLSQRLEQVGIRCPEDLSLITKAWEGRPTRMTCLRSSPRTMGRVAVDSLLDRASGRRKDPIRFVLPTVLDRGRSVRQLS